MRWKTKPEPKFRETRTVRRFCFLPWTFDGETRWLEFAEIKQEYLKCFLAEGYYWKDRGWA